jgi:hypothetical protein
LGEEYHRVICPHHVTAESRVTIDAALLRALIMGMDDAKCQWVKDGTELFNLANSDSPQVRTHTEVVLSVAAAQRILGVEKKSDVHELAREFANTLSSVAPPQLRVDDCSRPVNKSAKSLAEAWFHDLYADRGPVSHGRPRAIPTRIWTRDEHVLLAAYIIPRMTLVQLAAAGHYELTEGDKDEIAAFEYLLCLNNVFGSAEEGVATGLPERFCTGSGKWAWSEAIYVGSREREMQAFLREHGLSDE